MDEGLSKIAEKIEAKMVTMKEVIASDRFNDQQNAQNLRQSVELIHGRIEVLEIKISNVDERMGTIEYELTGDKYVNHQDLGSMAT